MHEKDIQIGSLGPIRMRDTIDAVAAAVGRDTIPLLRSYVGTSVVVGRGLSNRLNWSIPSASPFLPSHGTHQKSSDRLFRQAMQPK